VLGSRGVKWVSAQVKAEEDRPLGACPPPPSPGRKEWEADVSKVEAEVCKLNPPPEVDSITP